MFGTRVKGWRRSDVEDEAEKVNRGREQHLRPTVEEPETRGGKSGCP